MNLSRLTKGFITLSLSLSLLVASTSSAQVIDSTLATSTTTNKVLFEKSLWKTEDSYGSNYHVTSNQVIVNDYIYTACEDILYVVNKNTGVTLKEIKLDSAMGYVCQMTAASGKLFVPLSGGKIQAIDTTTNKSIWVSESLSGFDMNSAVTYSNGYIYGVAAKDSYDSNWNLIGSEGSLFALSVKDKDTTSETEKKDFAWAVSDTNGHYWATPYVENGVVLVGNDSGEVTIHSISNGSLIDTLTASGKIRSGIIYNEITDSYYFTSTDGYLYTFALEDNYKIKASVKLFIGQDTDKISYNNCTVTPTISGNKLYVFCGYYDKDYNASSLISVVTLKENKIAYQFTTSEMIQSTPLVSTTTKGNYVYFTKNAKPGGVYCFLDDEKATSVTTVYEPANDLMKQYCTASVIASNHNLYYSNDAGYLFGIQEVSTDSSTSTGNGSTITNTTSTTTVKAPGKVKGVTVKKGAKSKGKRKVKLSWTKVKNTTKYQIKYKTPSMNKYHTLGTTTKRTFTKKLSPGTYTIKVRAYLKYKGKTHYGKFSAKKKFKVK